MGVVYEGMREDIAQRAALKILRPEYATNPDLAGRFFNEARAANLIAHPGIVKVYDYGHNAGVAYLAMEYLEGESLWQRIERRGRLSPSDALRLARQIASALEAAHRVHIVHRDLKPDNVFIVADSESPGGERAKLLDFGIAKMADEYRGSVRTQVNVIMGTPTYMAPEQCRGSKGVADKTDVYALGVMLFEMLAGRPPFVAAEPGEYLALHMLTPAPSLREFVQGVPDAVTQLIDRMLAKDPAGRPNMAEVATQLRRFSATSGDLDVAILPEQPSAEPSLAGTAMAAEARARGLLPTVPGGVEKPSPTPLPPPSAPPTPSTPHSPGARRGSPLPRGGVPGVSGSSPVWVPMEIVKTDYVSTPDLKHPLSEPRRERSLLERLPPGSLLMIVFTACALGLTAYRLFTHAL